MATWARLGMFKLKELKKRVKLKSGTKKEYRYLILNLGNMLQDIDWRGGDQIMVYLLIDDPSQLLIVNEALRYRRTTEQRT